MAISNLALADKFQMALNDKWGYIWGTSGEEWTAAKQAALEKTTDGDRAQGRKYGKKWIGHMVADCSGLFTWAFRKLGGTMYHGSNTMYLKWCVSKGELKNGKRTDGKALKVGTAVFVWNGKTYSHVGLYVGGGLVIEAMGTISGVTTSKVTATKWTHWGELTGVEYDELNTPVDVKPIEGNEMPTLKRGSKGPDVIRLQTILSGLGYSLGPCGIDGDFGKATEAAVKAMQKDAGIKVDGVVGKQSWEALLGGSSAKYTVTIKHLSKTQADELKNKYKDITIIEE